MFHDYYLYAADEAALMAALYDDEGAQLVEGDIAIIGTISEPTGATTTDEEGNEVPVFAAVPGYHANLRRREPLPDGVLTDCLLPAPATPHCVWLGG